MESEAVRAARRLADDVLLPDAEAVDVADRIPEANLAALDAAGLTAHSLAVQDAVATGSLNPADALAERVDTAAALAGGCLATTFVWMQQQGALGSVARAPGPASRFTPDITTGALRAGVAITAVRGPRPLRIVATPTGWRITGSAPWVTGWGLIDVLRIAAVDEQGAVRTVLADVGAGMHGEPVTLVAANASATVTLTFDEVEVPADRLLDVVTMDEWFTADAAGLALNGALALGVAGRAASFLDSQALREQVAAARGVLLGADVAGLPAARAACSAVAMHAATALAAHDGGRGVSRGSRSDRLLREAHFLLAFGSRPGIRDALLQRYDARPPGGLPLSG